MDQEAPALVLIRSNLFVLRLKKVLVEDIDYFQRNPILEHEKHFLEIVEC